MGITTPSLVVYLWNWEQAHIPDQSGRWAPVWPITEKGIFNLQQPAQRSSSPTGVPPYQHQCVAISDNHELEPHIPSHHASRLPLLLPSPSFFAQHTTVISHRRIISLPFHPTNDRVTSTLFLPPILAILPNLHRDQLLLTIFRFALLPTPRDSTRQLPNAFLPLLF
jgi:hypothetical protein